MDRRCRAGEIEDGIYFHVEREGNVVPQHLEHRMIKKVRNILPRTGIEIVDTQHLMAIREETLA
jgi:hypothetical protein